MITVDYKNLVLKGLIEKQIGINIDLKKHHPNYNMLVEAIKVIIDWEEDIENGFVLEFNSDYTTIRKRKNQFFKAKS